MSPLCGALVSRPWPPVSSTRNRNRREMIPAPQAGPPERAGKPRAEGREAPAQQPPIPAEQAAEPSRMHPQEEAPVAPEDAARTNSLAAMDAAPANPAATSAAATRAATSMQMTRMTRMTRMRIRTPSKRVKTPRATAIPRTSSAIERVHVADPCRSAIRSSIKLATRSARIPSATRKRRLSSRAMLRMSNE